MQPRHLIAIALDEQAMDILFRDGATMRCMDGIPVAARFLGVYADFERRRIVAHFEHETFPLCNPGYILEERRVGYEIIEHPQAQTYDMIPVKIGMDWTEYQDMQQWVLDRAAQIEGRER